MTTTTPGTTSSHAVELRAVRQDFGTDPKAVRETDHYHAEYIQSFVEKWDELIDWRARADSEGHFFIDLLKGHGKSKVLDVATGTGFHSVQLLNAGLEVTSVDGNAEMLSKAFDNARDRHLILKTIHADWRWLNREVHGKFDAIICLGNSFTHLFDEHDRRRALAEFYAALKHDGILILDQRNYDAILDDGFGSKHKYYYCGEDVVAEPEHVDDGLARFRYSFPDGSTYRLNMFPLRKNYTRRLLREAGFGSVKTYGDFQETYQEADPDFFVHVAEKRIDGEGASAVALETESYYDSEEADSFYSEIWGGNDIHIGVYENEDDSVYAASSRTVAKMAARVPDLSPGTRVLDVGAGYGGAGRYLASLYECQVDCLNLSEVQNETNRARCKDAGLEGRVRVVHASFESIPADADAYDVVWSQDAILHSGAREQVLAEVARVLAPGGRFIFTDPMQTDDCPPDVLQPVLDRIHLDSLASPGFYRKTLGTLGLEEIEWLPMPEQLRCHYATVAGELDARRDEMLERCGADYVTRMRQGLQHWVDAADRGHLTWGILHFRRT